MNIKNEDIFVKKISKKVFALFAMTKGINAKNEDIFVKNFPQKFFVLFAITKGTKRQKGGRL